MVCVFEILFKKFFLIQGHEDILLHSLNMLPTPPTSLLDDFWNKSETYHEIHKYYSIYIQKWFLKEQFHNTIIKL